MNNPVVNILTRTNNREYFNVCKQSLESQTYKDINWIVGSDNNCDYHEGVLPLIKSIAVPFHIPQGHYYAPYNLHLNTLAEKCVEGIVTYMDFDDMYCDENSLQQIVDNFKSDCLNVWKVQITPKFIVPNYSFGHAVTPCDVSGIGIAFHTKYLPFIDWGHLSMGDYRVAKQLEAKIGKVNWIDKVLTRTQKGAHNGKWL